MSKINFFIKYLDNALRVFIETEIMLSTKYQKLDFRIHDNLLLFQRNLLLSSAMTGIRKRKGYRTCHFVHIKNVTETMIDPQICNLTEGYAIGGTKFDIGRHYTTVRQCVEDCQHMQLIDTTINGITRTYDGSCYCTRNMRNISRHFYKSCLLKPIKQQFGNRSKNTSRAMFSCRFQPGHGGYAEWVRVDRQGEEACVKTCINMKQTDASITGVTVYADTSKDSCNCIRKMTEIGHGPISFDTCFLQTPSSRKTETVLNVTLPMCHLQSGSGSGGSKIYLGVMDHDLCYRACFHLKKIVVTINGMTVNSNVTRWPSGCWCDVQASGVWKSRINLTCRFIFNTTEQSDLSNECNFQDGSGVADDSRNRSMVRGISEAKCIKSCMNRKKTDPNINGITRNSITKECWCESNMKRIGVYKTCFLK